MRGPPLKNSRRTKASTAHSDGGPVGPAGNPAANGLSTAPTTLRTRFATYRTVVAGLGRVEVHLALGATAVGVATPGTAAAATTPASAPSIPVAGAGSGAVAVG